jgi:CubicO group peptidase (beta-lactamase class C family)
MWIWLATECLIALMVVALQAAPKAGNTRLDAEIGAVFGPLVQPGDPGLAVMVKKGSAIVFEKGYGVCELRSRTKIDPETNFRLASVTKQFTAMAIMLLVHDGKLHYDDHLTDVFPDFPAYGKDITIGNLLNHTSGLPDYEELMEVREKSGRTRWTPEHQIQDDEVLALLKGQSMGRFAPGTRWEYSNSGYVVLGLIVAKVSGMPYREFLQRRIFGPLKMNDTLVYQKGLNTVEHRAYGHSKENGKLVETDQSATSATLGDGGVYSNIVDMGKWDEGLANHVLLSQEEMQPALTPVRLPDGSLPRLPGDPGSDNSRERRSVSYGFGWFLDPYQGHVRNYHDGETQGFRSTIQRFVNDGLTIVVLSNRTDLNPHELSLKVGDLLIERAH